LVWLGLASVVVAAILIRRLRNLYRHYFCRMDSFAFTTAAVDDVQSPKLGHYYVQARGRNAEVIEAGRYCGASFDPAGIPRVEYPQAGKQYNTFIIALYALENWELFLDTDDPRRRERFLKQADWLVAQQDQGKWYYRFDAPFLQPNLRNPWVSSIAQSLGISVVLRAWQLTGQPRYRQAAEAAFGVFQIPIERGGVVLPTAEGTWLEEYPDPAAPTHVLNGHMWSMFGLCDYWRALGDERARHLFFEAAAVLKANLQTYDCGYWVLYDQRPHPGLVNSAYMHFQIDQLRVLETITGEEVFGRYAARWEGYHRNGLGFCRILARGGYQKVRRLAARFRNGPPAQAD
jgi:hypothetical protein